MHACVRECTCLLLLFGQVVENAKVAARLLHRPLCASPTAAHELPKAPMSGRLPSRPTRARMANRLTLGDELRLLGGVAACRTRRVVRRARRRVLQRANVASGRRVAVIVLRLLRHLHMRVGATMSTQATTEREGPLTEVLTKNEMPSEHRQRNAPKMLSHSILMPVCLSMPKKPKRPEHHLRYGARVQGRNTAPQAQAPPHDKVG
jgi:hypothetical protein